MAIGVSDRRFPHTTERGWRSIDVSHIRSIITPRTEYSVVLELKYLVSIPRRCSRFYFTGKDQEAGAKAFFETLRAEIERERDPIGFIYE